MSIMAAWDRGIEELRAFVIRLGGDPDKPPRRLAALKESQAKRIVEGQQKPAQVATTAAPFGKVTEAAGSSIRDSLSNVLSLETKKPANKTLWQRLREIGGDQSKPIKSDSLTHILEREQKA